MTVTDIEIASSSAPLRRAAEEAGSIHGLDDHPSFPPVTLVSPETQVVAASGYNAIKGSDVVTGVLATPDVEALKPDVARFIEDIKDQVARGDLVLDSPDDVLIYAAAMIAAAVPDGTRQAISLAFEDRRHIFEEAATASHLERILEAQRNAAELHKQLGLKSLELAVLRAKAAEAIDAIDNPQDWLRAQEIMAREQVAEAYFREPKLQ